MRASIALLALLPLSNLAHAGPPDPAHCTVPAFVRVVGTQHGVPDPTGTFTVTIRDVANAPCPNIPVTLDFSSCDTRLALNQPAGAVLVPASNAVTLQTNESGVASFNVLGASVFTNCSNPVASGAGCARLCAAGVFIRTVTAIVYDLDGASGFDGLDGREFELAKLEVGLAGLGGPYHGRVDYDGGGTVNAADLNFFKSIVQNTLLGRGSGSGSNGAGFCVGPFTPYCP